MKPTTRLSIGVILIACGLLCTDWFPGVVSFFVSLAFAYLIRRTGHARGMRVPSQYAVCALLAVLSASSVSTHFNLIGAVFGAVLIACGTMLWRTLFPVPAEWQDAWKPAARTTADLVKKDD